MTSVLGLPSYVAGLLRHLEKHKNCLKWAVDNDASHKITLTLTWNFHQRRPTATTKENLWDRLQRAVTLSTATGKIPSEIRRLLDDAPKQRSGRGRFRRHMEWIRGSTASLPGSSRSRSPQRHCSFCERGASSTSLATPVKRYSWPRASSVSPARQTQSLSPGRTSTPLRGSTSLTSPTNTSNHTSPSHVKLAYKTEEEVETSLERVMHKVRLKNQEELDLIQTQWDETIREWPAMVRRESRRSLRVVTPTKGTPRSPPVSLKLTPTKATPPVKDNIVINPLCIGNSTASPPLKTDAMERNQNHLTHKVCVHRADDSATCKQSCNVTTLDNSTVIM